VTGVTKTRQPAAGADFTTPAVEIIDVPMADAVATAFTDFAAYVIGNRALPDARDGLKPVHRRILFSMSEMGLRPDHAHVKCARIVGDAIGKFHPHGDSAVYEALVRLGQGFSVSEVLIDPHGNFGSLDSGPAAMRYTEARLAPMALNLTAGLHEGTVDFVPNYDGSLSEPSVLPAAFPHLLVNGSTGIAVGMATNMAPHNLGEVVAATRHLLANPDASVKSLMKHLPGPDFPGGCQVIAGDGAREAYATGKGVVTMRAVASIEPVEGSRGRSQIVVSALPYGVGPEKIVESIKKGISDGKIQFVSDIVDLSEGDQMRLCIELKSGVNAESALASLYSATPMQQNFSIHNLALVDGRPRTLTLLGLLQVWIDFRREVVLRRSEFRRAKAQARLHLVDGFLSVLDGIEKAVKLIRASKTTPDAKDALTKAFRLSEVQATAVLEMPLRRLTSLELDALRAEKKELEATIADLTEIIEVDDRLVSVIDGELAEIGKASAARQSVLLGEVAEVAPLTTGAMNAPNAASAPVTDDSECTWHLTAAGLLVREPDAKKDVVISSATVTGHLMVFCSDGVAVKLPANLTDRVAVHIAANHAAPAVGIAAVDATVTMVTRHGVIKSLKADWPVRGDEAAYITLAKGDEVLAVGPHEGTDCVFVTSSGQLLRTPASAVRPQGRSGGGVAGIKLTEGARVVAGAVAASDASDVITITDGGKAKTTPLTDYPTKGRAGVGVRCHTFTKGSTAVAFASIAPSGGVYADSKGKTVKKPPAGKRDGSGS